MTSIRNVAAKQAQDEITVSVRQLLLDGAALSEVMTVLREVCFIPKDLRLLQKYDLWKVYQWQDGKLKELYSSPSLAPCVGFALTYEAPHD